MTSDLGRWAELAPLLTAMRCRAEVSPLPPIDALREEWVDLEHRASGTFFQSWYWMGAWLETIALPHVPLDRLRLIRVRDGSATIGLAIVCAGHLKRLRWFRTAAVFLNETGLPALDTVAVEYNGILAAHGREQDTIALAATAITNDLTRHGPAWDWSASRFNCMVEQQANAALLAHPRSRLMRRDACPLILAPSPAPGIEAYLGQLSANTRSQIRRALKLIGGHDAVEVQASTSDSIEPDLAELETLHRKSWQDRRGHSGAFENPHFGRFIRAIMSRAHAAGAARLIRIKIGSTTLGVMLNFGYRDRTYAYLSGFAQNGDKRIKTGLICHTIASCREFNAGARSYHFMAGESRYKKSLGTSEESLCWIELGRPSLDWWLGVAIRALRQI